jgi:hypothetical protein
MVSGGWAFGRTPLRRWVGTRLTGGGRGVVENNRARQEKPPCPYRDGWAEQLPEMECGVMVPDGMVPNGMIKTGYGNRAVTAGNGCREWSLVGGRSAERPYGDGWAHDWPGMEGGVVVHNRARQEKPPCPYGDV